VAVAAVAVCVGIAQGSAADASLNAEGPQPYTVGLFGDMPYNAQGKADYPFLLQDVNDAKVEFSIFDGDLKAGGDGPCADSLYTTALANFNSLERPLCWGRYGPGTQPYSDPIERLAHERTLFASTSQSLGKKTLTRTRESAEGGRTRSTRRTSAGRSGRSSTSA
jgi:hypothetical protein